MGKIVNVLHRMGFDEVFDNGLWCGSDTVIRNQRISWNGWFQGKNLPLFLFCSASGMGKLL